MKCFLILKCTLLVVLLFDIYLCQAAPGKTAKPTKPASPGKDPNASRQNAKCNLLNDIPTQIPGQTPSCEFEVDYIVVGTGAGGAPLMRKLSDDYRYSVLGFEAGSNKDDDPLVYDPSKNGPTSGALASTYGWQMKSTLVTKLNKALDISIARMLGGSTSHFGMMCVHPSKTYFDEWALQAGPQWSAANANAAYQRMEKSWTQPPLPNRGTNGLVSIRRTSSGPTQGNGAFIYKMAQWTSEYTGLPILQDYNAPNSPSHGPFYKYDLFVNEEGLRESSSRAFLDDVITPDGKGKNGRNLRILFKATVVRVFFDKNKVAKGVEYIYKGRTARAWAKKEVILAASIFSTQILQNSGIGNATHLQSLGVDVVFNNPNVGNHLANHPMLITSVYVDPNDVPTSFEDPSTYIGGAFLPQWYPNGTYSPFEVDGVRKYQILWIGRGGGNMVSLMVLMASPLSVGTERIQSDDPLQVPLHDEQMFLNNPKDLDDIANFLYYYLQNGLLAHIQAENPLYQGTWGHWNSPDEAKDYILKTIGTAYHYTGTNRMSTSVATGVVDWAGRVFGVSHLRVADSSVLPFTTDGNSGSPAMLVGFRIAEFIIDSR